MSHFAILVIGEDVEKQLQPYHEYECTGTKDEYVIWVDEHEEYLAEYENETVTRLVSESGGIFSPYDDKFHREQTE